MSRHHLVKGYEDGYDGEGEKWRKNIEKDIWTVTDWKGFHPSKAVWTSTAEEILVEYQIKKTLQKDKTIRKK